MLGDSIRLEHVGIIVVTVVALYLAQSLLRYIVRTEAEKLAKPSKPEPLRVPVIRNIPRICKTCRHFSKEEWQAALAANPVFAEASRWVSPNAMGQPVQRDEEGKPIEGVEDGKGPLSLKQNHWAVCTQEDSPNYASGLHQDDSCELWEASDAA